MTSWLERLSENFPEVAGPSQKRLSFKEKLKWTLLILLAFFILGHVSLFGLGQNSLAQFEFLSMILGAQFGSIISLGIGPIVTASIVLQLLTGSGLLNYDLTSPEGKKSFQALQKLLSLFFIIFEAIVFVFLGGLSPDPTLGPVLFFQLELVLAFQLFIGGILIMFMDEVVSKWGFGSGLSLFIAAGVSNTVFIQLISPFPPPNQTVAIGAIPAFFQHIAAGVPQEALLALAMVVSTVVVFAMSVYSNAMKVEIPLSFGRVRGHGIRWPLNFLYTSNIPVILVAAMFANIQLWASLVTNWANSVPGNAFVQLLSAVVGKVDASGVATSGLAQFTNLQNVNIIRKVIVGSVTGYDFLIAGVYVILMIIGCVIFSYFWVQTAGMDARNQAKQMLASGLQIPGFRRDERILERLLNRYIPPLAIMGGLAIGILAGFADITGAAGSGTGILLTVMIIFRLYEEIAQQHMMDMNPMLRKFMGG